MARRFLLIWLLLSSTALATTRYAGPAGAGTTCSVGSPCTMTYLWTVTVAGDTILLNNGRYQGTAYMLGPPAGKSGTATLPITVSAVNDGEVWFDGQDARNPCLFGSNNDYFVLEGFNCSNSSSGVFTFTNGSDHNIVRRVGAWHANPNANSHVFAVNYSSFENVFEECFGFSAGGGRKVFTHFGGSGQTTVRRSFFLWMYHLSSGPKMALSQYYNSQNFLIENCILGWNQQTGYSTQENYGPLWADRMDAGGGAAPGNEAARKVNVRVYGSMVLQPNSWAYSSNLYGAAGSEKVGAVDYKDTVIYLDTNKSSQEAFFGRNCRKWDSFTADLCDDPDLTATNVSLIGGTTPVFESQWVQTAVKTASTVSGIFGTQSLWDNDHDATRGAEICKRYENGVLTATPIFDADGLWPTNQRIIDAMNDAGVTPVNVTSLLESIFGAIPSTCKAGGSPPGSITLTAPDAGGTYISGSILSISWTSQGITGNVDVKVSRDGGTTKTTLATVAYNTSPYLWTVSAPTSTNVKFYVEQGAIIGASTTACTIKGRLLGMTP